MQINTEKKHFWIITSLIVLMIGALVFAEVNIWDSADVYGHGNMELVCATGTRYNNEGATMVSATKGGMSGSDIFETAANPSGHKSSITCRIDNGWIRTGCTESAHGGDTDTYMNPDNGCSAGGNDDKPTIEITCCKIELS